MQIKKSRSKLPLLFCGATEEDLPIVAIRNRRLLVRKYEPSSVFLNSLVNTLLSSITLKEFRCAKLFLHLGLRVVYGVM